ncbi:MBOAT family O-acyltransferase [Candidatus Protochlamydia phocaeensis]|uniref:MBOAT family O-acyltransferase n=1 Tax=Candidatus Protochlamydia phocaeensis TaxID=1414722 RepID=UPI000838C229|nr:MBOAT family protein [Candidatus Protochlamydia phocaeensis]
MLFNSYSFLLLYLPAVLTGFFSLARLRLIQGARAWLLISSLFFYAYWDVRFLPLLLGSILFNYACGSWMLRVQGLDQKKALLIFGIIADLALLFYFKYYNFFLSAVLGQASFIEVILPLGISFFTFTQIAYLVDAYQGKTEPCDMISYGLFVTIFPHLIAGPILHHKDMLKQFNQLRMYVVSWSNIAQGCFLFVIGMSKKVLIADHLSGFVKPIFDYPMGDIPFIQAWFGAFSYTLQLYFDFSGYSDMAVGLGLLFNLRLPINFNSPYQADSLIDFWRRWHITLSSFLRDYLYISLGGNRKGQLVKWRNLFITMLLGGIWHGAGWTFILWGACHGTFLVINHLWRHFNLSMSNWLARTLTLLAVIVAWVIFRSPDLSTAFNILAGMSGLHGLVLPPGYESVLAFLKPYGVVFMQLRESNFRFYDLLLLAGLGAAVLFLPNSNYWQQRFKQRPLRWAIPCGLLFLWTFLQLDDLAEFLYYQF